MKHTWTEKDDAALLKAVDTIGELAATLKPRIKLWSAVSGRLMPDLVVTADAARSRFERLQRLAQELVDAKAPYDAPPCITDDAARKWEEVSNRVAEYEMDRDDYIYEAIIGIRDSIAVVAARVEAVANEQQRLRKLWE